MLTIQGIRRQVGIVWSDESRHPAGAGVCGGHGGGGGRQAGSPRQMNKNGRRGNFSLGNMSRYKKYLFPVETSVAGGGCGVTQPEDGV